MDPAEIETIKRIVDNESVVKEMEMMLSHMRSEIGLCHIDFTLSSSACRKYGIQRGGVVAGLISTYIEVNLSKAKAT